MTYSALSIANYFIKLAKLPQDEGQSLPPLTPMKLIKLVYLAHGWNLGLRGEPLINEHVEAWQYGPVIASVYHEFKKFGNDRIEQYALTGEDRLDADEQTRELLNKVWAVYGELTAFQLSNMTHEANSPWDQAWNGQGGKKHLNHSIDNELIKKYFNDLAERNASNDSGP